MESHLSNIPADVCLGEVPSLNRRRLVAFFNCYIQKSVNMLNELALKCEKTLIEMERRLVIMNARLSILEKKVSDIDVQPSNPKSEEKSRVADLVEAIPPTKEAAPPSQYEQPAASPVPGGICDKYLKMLQMGVPEAAVKIKMQAEGVDPALLTSGGTKANEMPENESFESSTSSVEFSDSD